MTQRLSSRKKPSIRSQSIRRPAAKIGLFGVALIALSACGATTGAAQKGSVSEQVATARATIDPSYTLAPENDPAARRDAKSPVADYVRTAADVAMAEGNVFGAAVHLSKLYDETPRDRQVIYDLVRHMRYIGALTEAEQVLNDGLAIFPNDALLQLEKAKVFVAAGRADEAITLLEALRTTHPNDPAILQALGVALDRRGAHAQAQEVYAEAMALGRPSAALLSNAGMSYLMGGDPDQAETLLRDAAVAPGATVQVRQNLALVLALKGEMAEARRIATEAMPPDVAEEALEAYAAIAGVQSASAQHPWGRAAAQ